MLLALLLSSLSTVTVSIRTLTKYCNCSIPIDCFCSFTQIFVSFLHVLNLISLYYNRLSLSSSQSKENCFHLDVGYILTTYYIKIQIISVL